MPRRVCLGIGQTDELVADDVVREAERALELVEGATGGEALDHDVVAGLLLVDRVGVLALPPPIGLAVDRATGLGDSSVIDLIQDWACGSSTSPSMMTMSS